jgi:phage tail sheath protein FI
LIDNIAEVRKDCVVFISPPKSAVLNNFGTEADSVVSFRNGLRNSSYAMVDCNYKYQYDKYNDVYRWVPLNGDIAGITARTDQVRDPWFSPAGFNRGSIKNIVKLAWNPNKAQRDTLYSASVNPVVTFPGQGTVLFGDRTLLAGGTAFDYINVRRLFILLEKTIATAANQLLFEFNDEFTRLQFKNIVEPYLREISGRRGITDFLVVCDETNNTSDIVDAAKFVGDIYVKPARSINFIQLNFVGVGTSVDFNEIVGQF